VPHEPITVEVDRDLEDLVPMFMAQRRKDLGAIATALKDNDMDALRAIGHGMNGGGRSYGFSEITDIGEAMERAARARNVDDLTKLAGTLADYMARVVVKYV